MNLFLTQISLNFRNRGVLRDLGDPGSMHKTVMGCIDPDMTRTEAGLLYRLESRDGRLIILAQSTVPLQTDRLKLGSIPYATEILSKDASSVIDWIEGGRLLRYVIHVKTIRKTANRNLLLREADRFRGSHRERYLKKIEDMAAKGKSIEVPIRRSETPEWWNEVSARNGMKVETAEISDTPSASVASVETGSRVPLRSARISGIAVVENASAVKKALVHGIGMGRAYGLGLLSVGPAPSFGD
ncbi:type I-E CRISPR-associated protein Cas6/Cse3/CasE [Streptomyces sp. NPDC000927]|uniref:type I-E CRISPR-associated protein Cas6/Cse3/CasE n=1 Tax=Streptomyces sp. NPDC000927 TaxID=3154371 RepID=UPI0033321B27